MSGDAMSTPKLIAMLIAWVLASVMIAVVTAIVVTEVLRAVGIVETGSTGYTVSINALFVVVFVGVVSVPIVFRRRFSTKEPYEP